MFAPPRTALAMRDPASLQRRLERLHAAGVVLQGGGKGLEKESLRVDAEGCLALTAHPQALGSALTHPHITTDYSEALLEFVTSPFPRVEDTLDSLDEIHAYSYRALGEEMLWATSMPCVLGADDSIPIAEYGRS